MVKAWVNDARQWLRWLMGESRSPGRGHRPVIVPLLLAAALAVSGIAVVVGTIARSTAPSARTTEVAPLTPPPGSLDPIVPATTPSSSSGAGATASTLPPVPAPTHTTRTSRSRSTRTGKAATARATRSNRVGRRGTSGSTKTSATAPTTTTTTTVPQSGGWA